ncbi:vWA domain-containing protein [Ancylobacter mangrovi]|uniref:vWA domain-containing protein n=1 Tax=Ancylobacter mangrovi TaxID=2972472 RepID=UPI0021622F3F|nr:vWA domain-containing protein [Ancylobacter mangrovi]MCS0504730.1 VWA domain-containing protein [Ancylobacter mangrovi]
MNPLDVSFTAHLAKIALPAGLALDHPLMLLALPLALLPLCVSVLAGGGVPSSALVPPDAVSRAMAVALRLAGALAIVAILLGLAGLHRRAERVSRVGTGAHLVLLLDRSSSMDNNFAGRAPSGDQESKSAAAKRLLTAFVQRRPLDRIGVAAFSTSPMSVLPLTDHHAAVEGAIAAIDRPGLAFTDVGRGLALALSSFADDTSEASRAVVLVSDGAGLIDRRVQDALRDGVARTPVHIYWLFLRSRGAAGIFEKPPQGEDTPQAHPERHLHLFLESLGVPYRAFEAGDPQAVEQAIDEIDRQETRPIVYEETVPRRDLARAAFAFAGLCVAGLLVAKLAERRLDRRTPETVREKRASRVARPVEARRAA